MNLNLFFEIASGKKFYPRNDTNITLKVGIFSPYFDTLGGGERYVFTFAEYCLQRNFDVEIFWDTEEVIAKAQQRFDLNLSKLKTNRKIYQCFLSSASYLQKIAKFFWMKKYDLLFFLTDGSIPFLAGKQNWLHFQVPFQLDGKNFATQHKLSKVNRVICNSFFTKRFIDKTFGIESEVIYPPVSIYDFENDGTKKENIILSVGRFDQIMNSKRQDVLINVFKKMCDQGLENWQLVLVGGCQHNEDELLRLRKMAVNYPIDFRVNASFSDLRQSYEKAKIYWHAAGFEVDEDKNPDQVEHFGISLVEAMAAGCLPIVCEAGGIKEIIEDKVNGYFWQSEDQLQNITQNMIKDLTKEEEIIINAQKRAADFAKEKFFTQFDERLK